MKCWAGARSTRSACASAASTGCTPRAISRSGWFSRTAAFQAESPLDGELVIERERWAVVERLQVGHYFDTEALVAYGLKLRILERTARFEVERGRAAYGEVYRDILGASGAPGPGGSAGTASEDTGVTT